MYARQGYEPLKETHEAAKIGFILTELDLALTFCRVAESADDEGKAKRNKAHARKAYDSAIHFLASATLTPQIKQEISDKIERLRLLLAGLGEAL